MISIFDDFVSPHGQRAAADESAFAYRCLHSARNEPTGNSLSRTKILSRAMMTGLDSLMLRGSISAALMVRINTIDLPYLSKCWKASLFHSHLVPPKDRAMPYEAIFSLGSDCTPATQIRRYFKRRPSSCFDWIVTPIASIEEILADDGARFGLRVSACFNGTSAFCENYGVVYHHEFDRTTSNAVIFTPEALRSCREKLIYKYNKMLDIARTRKTLFVRYVSATDAPGDQQMGKTFGVDDLQEMVTLLEKKLGHSRFHVAYFRAIGNAYDRSKFTGPVPERCSIHQENHVPEQLGEVDVWNVFFSKMGLSPDRPPLL